MKETLPTFSSQLQSNVVLQEVHDRIVLNYFIKQIPFFEEAVHLSPHANTKPALLPHVRTARKYLNEVFGGYKLCPEDKISQRIIGLQDVASREVVRPCLVTFLDDVTPDKMFEELDNMIKEGQILGVADSNLAATFIHAKLFETGKSLKSYILIPQPFQKKKSSEKRFFKKVSLERTVDYTNDTWSIQETERHIERGISILALIALK